MPRLPSEQARYQVGLPQRPFLYTLDQIAALIATSLVDVKNRHIHFVNRDVGVPDKNRMQAHNIGTKTQPDWRVSEVELIRWLRKKGFHIYEA